MIERTLYSSDHLAFADSFQRFIDKEIAPFHEAWEEQGFVDREVWRRAGENGFLCATVPEPYGGSGVDRLYSVIQMEALARGGFSGIGFGDDGRRECGESDGECRRSCYAVKDRQLAPEN